MSGLIQPSFTAGEISPSLYGRIDLAKYLTGLKTCRNFIVRQYGGVSNRPGTRFVVEVKDSTKKVRLIPFQFSTVQTYVLEFGDHYMRVVKDGGQVLYPVGHPSAGNPVEIATPYTEADLSLLKYTQSADVMTITHPSYPTQQLTRTDHHEWTIAAFANVEGPFKDINVDDDMTVYASSLTGNVTVTASHDIFTSGMVGKLLYIEQSPDSLTKRWEVEKAIIVNDIRRAGANYYQAASSGTTGTIRPDHTEGTSYDGSPGVAWKYLHSGSGIVLITGFTSAKIVTGTVRRRLPDSVVTIVTPKAITNVTPSPDGAVEVKVTIAGHGFADNSTVTVSGVVGTVCNGTWEIDVIDADNFSLKSCTDTTAYTSGGTATQTQTAVPTYKWALESWGGADGYPGTTTYYQQRQCFARSDEEPQTVWMSTTGGYTDFRTSNPILDDDGVTFKIASREVNEIRHIVELSELILLTSGGEWVIKGADDGVLTPSSVKVKRQGYNGSSHIAPLIINNNAIYVQDKGNQIRTLGYSFQSDSYIGNDLTVLSSHLFANRRIVDWTYQQIPYSCVWAVRDDGALLGLTYLQEQEVAAWHRHDTTGGYFESVCTISEGDEDAVYFVVKRGAKRFIEKLASRSFSDVMDAFFVDSGLSYDGRNTTATTMTISGGTTWGEGEALTLTASAATFAAGDVGDRITFTSDDGTLISLLITGYTSGLAVTVSTSVVIPAAFRAVPFTDWTMKRNVFAGLGHLEGQTVAVLADGNVHGQVTVAGGSITLNYHAGVVHAGIPIDADIETLILTVAGQNLLDKKKLITKVTLLCEASRGIWAGPNVAQLREYKSNAPIGSTIPLTTGMFEVFIPAMWDKNGSVVVRQADPLPISILALIPEVTVAGT